MSKLLLLGSHVNVEHFTSSLSYFGEDSVANGKVVSVDPFSLSM